VCKRQIWRSAAEIGAPVGTDDALAPGRMCGSCRTGTRPFVGECGVCFAIKPLVHFSHPRKPPGSCAHYFCCGCWVSQIEVTVNEARMEARCMGEGCSECLSEKDVKRLAPELFAGFCKNKYEQYEGRLKAVFIEDDAFGQWARRNTQGCPRCHVLVQRSEGCNHMSCRCGHEFCYKCGRSSKEDCNCPYATDGPVLIAGQLELLAPILADLEARASAAKVLQRSQRAKALASGRLDGCVAAALMLQAVARCHAQRERGGRAAAREATAAGAAALGQAPAFEPASSTPVADELAPAAPEINCPRLQRARSR